MEEASQDRGYTVGTWRNLPNYRCQHCPWDTLQLQLMEQHLRADHGIVREFVEVEVSRPLSVSLYDAGGQLIRAVSEKRLIPKEAI